jgi:prepilin-type N-terminal cleavage/methylation domain-containing protein
MKERTRKKGFTLVEILIVVTILGILAAILIPQFKVAEEAKENWRDIPLSLKTDIGARIHSARPETREKAFLRFHVSGKRWGLKYEHVQFKDYWPYGSLDEVFCAYDEVTFGPDDQYSEGESWDQWLKRYEEVGKEYSTGLKSGAEETLQAKKEEE